MWQLSTDDDADDTSDEHHPAGGDGRRGARAGAARPGAVGSIREREVVRNDLRALTAQDRAVEAWLLGDVAAAYDAMRANSEDVIETADERAHLAAWQKA